MTVTPVPVPGWRGGEGRQRSAGTVRLRSWLRAEGSALLCVAAQGGGVPVPRWSWTMATACCWVSLEPAENA
jgi:hypothetical protein